MQEGVLVFADSLNKLWMREILSIGKDYNTTACCQDSSAALSAFQRHNNALIGTKSLSSLVMAAQSPAAPPPKLLHQCLSGTMNA